MSMLRGRSATAGIFVAALLAASVQPPAAHAQQAETGSEESSPPAAGDGLATERASPGLGESATTAQIDGWDIGIGPDGAGLPPGSGTPAQGAEIYATKCIACHGVEGRGQPNDALVGGHGTLDGPEPVRTIGSYWPYATTVFDYIRRAMPYTQPQSLTNDEVYALTAYLLQQNGVIEEDATMNAETLPSVVMPNRDGFTWGYPDWRN